MFSVDANEVILYVEDQDRARTFYIALLAIQPSLDVPGMTEFDLGGMTLGLMPQDDILQLLPDLQAAHRPALRALPAQARGRGNAWSSHRSRRTARVTARTAQLG